MQRRGSFGSSLRATKVIGALLLAIATGCGAGIDGRGANNVGAPDGQQVAGKSDLVVDVPGVLLGDGIKVGAPLVINNLAVFPVYATVMEDLGDFTSLEAALERGAAEVRELGAGNGQQRGDGAEVNTLVIENKGDIAILVLAGTVVKGGKQDRQIGQDFIIGAKQTTPVDAFCVEHGRWTGTREGQKTDGKFKAARVLANDEVRAAGQYNKNQSEVWSNVSKVNKAMKKESASDTLTASLDDKDVNAEREAMVKRIDDHFRKVAAAGNVVGLAYAVDGKIKGARWFFHHKVFQIHKETLMATAAGQAITSLFAAKAEGKKAPDGKAAPEDVVAMLKAMDQKVERKEQRDTPAENVNQYQFSNDGYASEMLLKVAPAATAPKPGSPPSKGPPAKKTVTKDYMVK